ncbi:adenine-specific methyltransferase EcoRI family protein [Dysosmobacter sp. Sow4_B12]|uniref:adenine-specific methyltransferase EcoRI family protein n=1 Tax=Dysosmobacter sp. Sow4_B12 TaxID=3438777 RepID=UPI003F904066
MEADKQFLIIGDQNALTCKEIFPLIQANKIWLGKGFQRNAGYFESPCPDTSAATEHQAGLMRIPGVLWFTNLDYGRRHQLLVLRTIAENLQFSRHRKIRVNGYLHYDN